MVGGWEEGEVYWFDWLIDPSVSPATRLNLVIHSVMASSWEYWGETLSSTPGLLLNGSTLAYIWTHSLIRVDIFFNEGSTWDNVHLLNFLPGSWKFLSSYLLETKCFMYVRPGQVLPVKGSAATSCLHHPLCWRKNKDDCFVCISLACICQEYNSVLPKQTQNDNKAKRYILE